MINKVDRLTSSPNWWKEKRLKYNKGLIISGIIAFIIYCALGEIIISPHEEFEETIFEMFFQGCAYLMMMLIANVFYTLGSAIDTFFNKNNSSIFRERLFSLGYWFSFSLPIMTSIAIMILYVFRIDQRR